MWGQCRANIACVLPDGYNVAGGQSCWPEPVDIKESTGEMGAD